MTLEQGIYAALAAHAGVAALAGDRIYPVEAPQGTPLPRIVFARQETENLATLRGRGTHDRVQVAVLCFADDVQQVRDLAIAARDALDGRVGAGADAIQSCRLVGRLQARVREAEADPGILSDALLFTILTVET